MDDVYRVAWELHRRLLVSVDVAREAVEEVGLDGDAEDWLRRHGHYGPRA
jgi:hypothetical protein